MAKELKDYTTDELFNELWRRTLEDPDVFSVQLWMRKDVMECFEGKSDDEITEYMDSKREYFTDRCTELGWEVMYDLDY